METLIRYGLKYFLYNLNSFFISCDITKMKDIIIKIIISKMDSYQNKMLVIKTCINVLNSSFTSMQSFLNILLVRKKFNQRKILPLLSKNNQFNKKRKRKLSKNLG